MNYLLFELQGKSKRDWKMNWVKKCINYEIRSIAYEKKKLDLILGYQLKCLSYESEMEGWNVN